MSWIDVDYDVDTWLWMPTQWGDGQEFADHRDWARVCAEALWEVTEAEPEESEVDNLALTLAALAERIPAAFEGREGWDPRRLNSVYVYLPDVRRRPLPLYVETWPVEGPRDVRLAEFVREGDREAVEKPLVDAFATEHLGEGLRSLRYFTEPAEHALGCSLNYAWRIPEHGFDLRLWTSTGDLGDVFAAMDDFDALARSIVVRHDDERD